MLLAGCQWGLHFAPAVEYLAARQRPPPWTVLGGGLAFTSLLGALLLIVTARTTTIEQLMVEHIAELETSKRMEAKAEQGRRQAEALAKLARTINVALDVDTVLQRVAVGAMEVCNSDGGRRLPCVSLGRMCLRRLGARASTSKSETFAVTTVAPTPRACVRRPATRGSPCDSRSASTTGRKSWSERCRIGKGATEPVIETGRPGLGCPGPALKGMASRSSRSPPDESPRRLLLQREGGAGDIGDATQIGSDPNLIEPQRVLLLQTELVDGHAIGSRSGRPSNH